MNAKEFLEKLKKAAEKVVLSKEEVKLETAEIVDADVMIEAESFEVGNEVFVIADDERVPLPVGEYQLTDGNVVVVEEEGIIAFYGQASTESEEEVVEEEQEMESEEKTNPKKVVESVSKEIHFSEEQINEISEMFKKWYAELQEVKDAEFVEKEEVVELSNQVPQAKPIKHSPESKTRVKQLALSSNRRMTTVDRILARQNSRK